MSVVTVFLGKDAVLYQGAAGTQASTELKHIKDVKVGIKTTMIDSTTRASGGWKTSSPGLKEGELSFTVKGGSDDYDTLMGAIMTGTPLAFYAKPSKEAGAKGLDADFHIESMDETQDLDDVVWYECKAVPTLYDDTRPPKWQ